MDQVAYVKILNVVMSDGTNYYTHRHYFQELTVKLSVCSHESPFYKTRIDAYFYPANDCQLDKLSQNNWRNAFRSYNFNNNIDPMTTGSSYKTGIDLDLYMYVRISSKKLSTKQCSLKLVMYLRNILYC